MKTKSITRHFIGLACIGLMFSVVGCRTDNAQPEPQSPPLRTVGEKLLIASSSNLLQGIEMIEYNADQKPEKIIVRGVGNVLHVVYEANKVTYDITKFGKVYARRVYELENGIAGRSIFYSVDSSGTATESTVTTYAYKAGKLYRETVTPIGQSGGFYCEYIYDSANENVATREIHDLDGKLQERRTYEYTNIADKSVLVNQWTAANVDGMLFPQRSKYLLDKMTVEYNGSVLHSTFSYELDQHGYVVKGREISDEGHHKEVEWTYHWQ